MENGCLKSHTFSRTPAKEAAQEQIGSLQIELKEAQDTSAMFAEQSASHLANNRDLREQLKTIQQALTQAQQTLQQQAVVESEVQPLRVQIIGLTAQLQQLQGEYDALYKQVENLMVEKEKISRAAKQNVTLLNGKLQKAQQTIDALSNAPKSDDARIQGLRDQIQRQQQELAAKNNEIERARSRLVMAPPPPPSARKKPIAASASETGALSTVVSPSPVISATTPASPVSTTAATAAVATTTPVLTASASLLAAIRNQAGKVVRVALTKEQQFKLTDMKLCFTKIQLKQDQAEMLLGHKAEVTELLKTCSEKEAQGWNQVLEQIGMFEVTVVGYPQEKLRGLQQKSQAEIDLSLAASTKNDMQAVFERAVEARRAAVAGEDEKVEVSDWSDEETIGQGPRQG